MYFFPSLRKLATIKQITAPMGKAAIILTDCKLVIELLENKSAIGNNISRIHHTNSTILWGFFPSSRR